VLDGPGGAPTALAPTEVEKPAGSQVYGTEEKYLHGSGVLHHTPMRVDVEVLHAIRHRAAEAFAVLGLRHMARIDGFRTPDGTIVVTDVNGIGGMGFSSFVFQQAAMIGMDHRRLIMGLLRVALGGSDVTGADGTATTTGSRRIHVVLGGPTSERQVSRQSGCFVGLSLVASGDDVRFYLMDLQSRYTEIGLFYVLHHDVEEIQALVGDPVRRATIVSLLAYLEMKIESSIAESPAPITTTSWSLKKAPSQTPQVETPRPPSSISPGSPSRFGSAPMARMIVLARCSSSPRKTFWTPPSESSTRSTSSVTKRVPKRSAWARN